MGRTAAWIDLPEFAAAVAQARRKGAAFRVVVFFEGDAYKHFENWMQIGAQVRFFEHGFMRLLLFDNSDAILAFPKDVTSLGEEREYFGWHIRNADSVLELRNYFEQIWKESQELPETLVDGIISMMEKGQSQQESVRAAFPVLMLKFFVRVTQRAFPEWFPKNWSI